MSAWIVSKRHIDLMVLGMAEGTREGIVPFPTLGPVIDRDKLGQMLVTECVASVQHRYGGDKPEELPGPSDNYYLQPYLFAHPNYSPSAAELHQACRCYSYQSCEHPGWETAIARTLCDQVCEAIAAAVPNLERRDAPWGFDEEALVTLRQQFEESRALGLAK